MKKQTEHRDAYFFNKNIALEVAKQKNRTKKIGAITGLQICYYTAEEAIKEAPENCIFLPLENVYNYFVTSENRIPTSFNFEGSNFSNEEEKVFLSAINEIYNAIAAEQKSLIDIYKNEIKKLSPDFSEKKLRIYITVSGDTTVMRHVAKAVAETFEETEEYEVLLHVSGEMSAYYELPRLVKHHNFNPHITFNINYENNDYINDDIINIVWYQDPMPQLKSPSNLNIREKDIVFSLTDQIMPKNISYKIQKTCVDNNIFFRIPHVKKENKIIFMGSKYIKGGQGINTNVEDELIKKFRLLLEKGEKVSKDIILNCAATYNLSFNQILYGPLSYVVRELTVEWICRQNIIKVEVYGRFWEDNKIVSPFFKGEIPFGKELNNIYNSAKYALSSHPSSMYMTRVAEMSSCETIPVIYDSRNLDSIKFEHEKNSLLFSTYDELIQCLSLTPKNNVTQISKDMSYSSFVKKMILEIKEAIKK